MADPPPVGGHTGATTDPTTNPLERTFSASRWIPLSSMSMLMWGSYRKMSTPSNLMPSTSAAAVRSSIVSRSMVGSAPGLPLPTSPGHIALCNLGNVLGWLALMEYPDDEFCVGFYQSRSADAWPREMMT